MFIGSSLNTHKQGAPLSLLVSRSHQYYSIYKCSFMRHWLLPDSKLSKAVIYCRKVCAFSVVSQEDLLRTLWV